MKVYRAARYEQWVDYGLAASALVLMIILIGVAS